jgi:RNAse (barnase) inhibitor barstar
MRHIELDAKNWTSVLDFYSALLPSIGAPEWHGRNINALIDSMIWGGINRVEPPYTIRIRDVVQLPGDVRNHIELAKNALLEARAEFRIRHHRDVEVRLDTCS